MTAAGANWPPGTHVAGRYRVKAALTGASTGGVIAQTDDGRSVVLRTLPTTLVEDGERLHRLRDETRALAGLRHPGLVRTLEIGLDVASSRVFVATELVDAMSVYALIGRQGPLDAQQVMAIAVGAASLLAATHAIGVVHGDLKTEHLLIDRTGTVRIIDFGLGRTARFPPNPKLSKSSTIIGTPETVAPEVARGGRADARSDVYSLGVCLFEALSGEPPWTGDITRVLLGRVTSLAPSPSQKCRGLDRRIDALVVRTLAPDPRARMPSMSELERAAEPLAAGATLLDVSGSDPAKPARTPSRAIRTTVGTNPENVAFSSDAISVRTLDALSNPNQVLPMLAASELDAIARSLDEQQAPAQQVEDVDWLKLSMSPEQMREVLRANAAVTGGASGELIAPPLRQSAKSVPIPETEALVTSPVPDRKREAPRAIVAGGPTAPTEGNRPTAKPKLSPESNEGRSPLIWVLIALLLVAGAIVFVLTQ